MCPSTVKNSLLAGERAGLGGCQHQGKNLATVAKNAELSILSLLFGDFLSGQYLGGGGVVSRTRRASRRLQPEPECQVSNA